MTETDEEEGAFENRCENAASVLAPCIGYFVERVSFDAFAEEDFLEISLREGPRKADVRISLCNLHYVSVSKPPELSGSFVDSVSLVHLPRWPHPWPDDVAGRLRRFAGLPELAWLRLTGPTEVDVIASILTVYTAMSDDEATARRIS
ncbi:hypothetical protein ABT052_19630 [Streptomyces sp. NPDC002766]|uniref:hypothetical protein n=1 Tax=unclassified Streptomyces TaxID=2593676 RepID=UPI003321EEC5